MDEEKTPLVSIIIVNFNGKYHLEKCLNSLSNVNYKNYEIILVDNNSSDGSIKFVQESYMSVIIKKLDKNYGFAEPNNIGAKMAKGELLLFLNNDTYVEPNFITELVNAINQDPKIAICQSLLLKPNGEIDSSGDFINNHAIPFSSKEKIKEIKEIFSARAASMLVRKEIFLELEGFDVKFFVSFEDVDLGWRAWICGYKIIIAPKSIVYHVGGQTVKELSSEIKFHGTKNYLIIRLTNFENQLIVSLIKIFYDLITGKANGHSINNTQKSLLPSVKIAIKGIFWILKNLRYVIVKHKKINLNRKRTTQELIKLKLIIK